MVYTPRSGVRPAPGNNDLRKSRGRGRRYTGRVRTAVAEDVPVSDRRPLGGVSQFLSQFGFGAEPLARKPLILQMRRDVRVVEGARLENDSGELHRVIQKHLFTQSIQRLPAAECLLM